jgi:hypothetical protein
MIITDFANISQVPNGLLKVRTGDNKDDSA